MLEFGRAWGGTERERIHQREDTKVRGAGEIGASDLGTRLTVFPPCTTTGW